MTKETRWAWLFNCTSAALILALPVLVYLKHHGYPLARPEVLAIFCGLLGLGCLVGLAMTLGRSLGLVAGTACLLILLLDVQTDWFDQAFWLELGLFLLMAVLGWLIRKYLARLMTLAFGVMFLTTAVLPGGQPVVRVGEFPDSRQQEKDLPLVLHLILDEHIGIEGIPREFDPQGEIAAQVRDFFLENDFQVFGRAYSRYYDSYESLSNLVNFSASDTVASYFGGKFETGDLLVRNRWFDHLHGRGYGINVMQSDYMRFFGWDHAGNEPPEGRCLAYTNEAIQPVARAPLTSTERLPLIIGPYIKLSSHLQRIYSRYRRICLSGPGSWLHLPDPGHLERTRVSPLSAWEVVAELKEWLAEVPPGQAIFAHVLLPHYPFAFDADCTLETKASLWLEGTDPSARPHRNDAESRALRYPPYLEQVLCTKEVLREMFEILQERGLWEDAIVVVHGDHGSRIDKGPPKPPTVEKMTESDFQDAYSTLFAVKGPGLAGEYRREQLPIDQLLKSIMVGGLFASQSELESHPFVYIRSSGKIMVQRPIAHFDHGVTH